MSTVPTWAAVERRANERVKSALDQLAAADLADVPRLQAEVKAWRDVLALPTTLASDTQLEPNSVGY